MWRVKKGMTLIEIVISLAIIAIMLIPIMNSLLTSVRINQKSEEVQDAKLLGQQVIEEFRLEDDIKEGNSINLEAMVLTLGTKVPTIAVGDKEYFPVSSSSGGEFNIEGKIYTSDTHSVNNKKYTSKKLGAFLVIKNNEVYYYESSSTDLTIKEYVLLEESKGKYKKISTIDNKVKVEFKDSGTDEEKIFNIFVNGKQIGFNTINGLGMYVVEKTNLDFEIINKTNKTQDIYIFRDSNLSKNDGILDGNIQSLEGLINKYDNIIFDSKNQDAGLYSITLDIKKDENIIETIESQIYIGE